MMLKPLAATLVALTMMDAAVGAADAPLQITRAGSRAVNAGPAQWFTGEVKVEMLYTPSGAERTSAGSVTFSPGARTNWHSHPLGQTLIVTAGVGRVQQWGGAVQEIRAGDVVHIPPEVKHWHGAAPGSAMTHIAVQEAQDGKTADWLEAVSEVQYGPAAVPVGAPFSAYTPPTD